MSYFDPECLKLNYADMKFSFSVFWKIWRLLEPTTFTYHFRTMCHPLFILHTNDWTVQALLQLNRDSLLSSWPQIYINGYLCFCLMKESLRQHFWASPDMLPSVVLHFRVYRVVKHRQALFRKSELKENHPRKRTYKKQIHSDIGVQWFISHFTA
jgi:hypothetical protein